MKNLFKNTSATENKKFIFQNNSSENHTYTVEKKESDLVNQKEENIKRKELIEQKADEFIEKNKTELSSDEISELFKLDNLKEVDRELKRLLEEEKSNTYIDFLSSLKIEEEWLPEIAENISKNLDKINWNEKKEDGSPAVFTAFKGKISAETLGINSTVFSFPPYNLVSVEKKKEINKKLEEIVVNLNKNKNTLYNILKNKQEEEKKKYIDFLNSLKIEKEWLPEIAENISKNLDKINWNEKKEDGSPAVFTAFKGKISAETLGINSTIFSFPPYNLVSVEKKKEINKKLEEIVANLNKNKNTLYNILKNKTVEKKEENKAEQEKIKDNISNIATRDILISQNTVDKGVKDLSKNSTNFDDNKKTTEENKDISTRSEEEVIQEKKEVSTKSQEKITHEEKVKAFYEKANQDFYQSKLLPFLKEDPEFEKKIREKNIQTPGGRVKYGGSALIAEVQELIGMKGRDIDGLTGTKTEMVFEEYKKKEGEKEEKEMKKMETAQITLKSSLKKQEIPSQIPRV